MAIMTGFAPSKLFETAVDKDVVAERLATMRQAAEIDPVEHRDELFKLWLRLDPRRAEDARLQCIVKTAAEVDEVDIQPILDVANDDIRKALVDKWGWHLVASDNPAPPENFLPDWLARVCVSAVRATHRTMGIEKVLDYPELFLDWVCCLIGQMAQSMASLAYDPTVCIHVPNVDIPLRNDARVAVVWGSAYVDGAACGYAFEIPWYGRHVVKKDWLAYARLLALVLNEVLPITFEEEED